MFQLPQFVWALRSSVCDVFINFLLIDKTDKSKISSDQKRFFIALSLYPLSFFANTPFKYHLDIHVLICIVSLKIMSGAFLASETMEKMSTQNTVVIFNIFDSNESGPFYSPFVFKLTFVKSLKKIIFLPYKN